MDTMNTTEILKSFCACNYNAKCRVIMCENEEVVVEWFYCDSLVYTLQTTLTEARCNTMKLQKSKHAAKLIMNIRAKLLKIKATKVD